MRDDTILRELRRARPAAPAPTEPPLAICEAILAAGGRPRRRMRFPGWGARSVALIAGMLTLAGAATAATLIATSAPAPNGREVMGPVAYVAYWEHGRLARITDCAMTPDAIECRGDAAQRRTIELRIQDETIRAIATGRDKGAGVLFLAAGGGEVGCAGAPACSYMAGEPNAGKPLPEIE